MCTQQLYPNVFKDDLGTVKGLEAKIHIDPESTLLFYKAQPVLFALREKVEAECERLQQQGTIELVQFFEWVVTNHHHSRRVITINVRITDSH